MRGMDEREALITAILDAPDDDLPRLVLADWLDEHGENDRAEFIRLQIELAPFNVRSRGGNAAIPTHRCKVCAALWVLWVDDGGWSLCSANCEPCCDNVKMLDQIEPLTPAVIDLFCREQNKLIAHAREWFGSAIPGASVSNWSPHNPVPYFVLPGDFANIEITRGFVGGVSLPMAAFIGDGIRCSDCAESPADPETNVVECRRCDSTGILFEPVSGELFALHPLTTVRLDDRTPNDYGPPEDGCRFGWLSEHEHGGPAGLPRELLKLIPRTGPYGGRWPTAEEAQAALSDACVAWGRSLVAEKVSRSRAG